MIPKSRFLGSCGRRRPRTSLCVRPNWNIIPRNPRSSGECRISRSLVAFEQDATFVTVLEMSQLMFINAGSIGCDQSYRSPAAIGAIRGSQEMRSHHYSAMALAGAFATALLTLCGAADAASTCGGPKQPPCAGSSGAKGQSTATILDPVTKAVHDTAGTIGHKPGSNQPGVGPVNPGSKGLVDQGASGPSPNSARTVKPGSKGLLDQQVPTK